MFKTGTSSRSLKLLPAAGAIAGVIAFAGPAWSQEGPKNDEVFSLSALIGPDNTNIGNPTGVTGLVSFDISWFDPVLQKYYLADRSNKTIDILDLSTSPPTLTQKVNTGFAGFTGNNDTSGPDGLATINNHTEVWVGDTGGGGTGPGQVWVLNTDASVKTIPVMNPIPIGNPVTTKPSTTRADEFCYDLKDNLIMIASPAENANTPANTSAPFVTFISTKTYKVVGQLVFDGKPGNGPQASNGLEQCGWSAATGLFYQNVPEINGAGNDTSPGGIAVIDPKSVLNGSPKVEKVFNIPHADCAGPQGMAIGPSNQILEGCNAASDNGHRNLVIVNIRSGGILSVIPDLGGADEVWFNPGDGHYFVPTCNTECRTVGQGVNGQEVLGVIDSAGRKLDQSVQVAVQNTDTTVTKGNPRTIHSAAAASNTNQVFLPIPAVGGTAPQFDPTLCDNKKVPVIGPGTPSSANGCIAILSPSGRNDNPRTVQERGPDDRQN